MPATNLPHPNGRSKVPSLLLLALSCAALIFAAYRVQGLLALWYLMAGIGIATTLAIGHLITGRYLGPFIDNRNVVSLSRVQLLAWTTLLLSAFLAAAFWNVEHGAAQAIAIIRLDPQLWALMGISTTTLVGSPLLLNAKKNRTADAAQLQRTLSVLGEEDQGASQGQVFARATMDQASWKDLFTGEETGNAAHLDLSRLQMFFFTAVSLIVYWVCLRGTFLRISGTGLVTELPNVPEGLLWLIGISHGGYLAMKAVPHSLAGSEADGQAGNATSPVPAPEDQNSSTNEPVG